MFTMCDLHFVRCSFELDVLCAQRIMGILILITHKSMRSESVITWYYIQAKYLYLSLFYQILKFFFSQ